LESFDRQARGEISLAEEVPIQRKNGEIFFADISASLITLGRAEYLIGIFRDITERRRVESERQEAQAFLETAIAQSPSGILIADAPDVTIRMANPIALTIRGAGPDHLTGIEVGHHAPNWQTFRPDGSPYPSEQLPLSRAVLNGEVTLGEEVIIRDESDQDHWVMANAAPIRDSEGHVTAGIVVFHDITERKRAERALRESEERLGQIVHGTSIATFVVDREHRITHWNKACEALTGLRAQDMCGTQDQWRAFYAHKRPTMADLVLDGCPEDVVEKYYGTAYRPASVVKGAFEAEGHFAGLGENGKWLFFTAAPLMDHDGRVTGAIETLQDITDRKRAEQERLEYERKLRFLASELSLAEERERRRLAAGLHDEACQTLVLTNMKLQELRQSMGGPEDQPLAEICEKLTSTIQSVRDLTFDLSSPTLYKFGLEAALEELLHDKLKAEHGIRCRFGDDGAPKPLAEDVRILLYQSVRELLMNVIKHANADEVSLDTQRDGDSIRVTVTDDGVGFEVDALLASPSRNRGFGLFNIKERLDYIGGRVEIEAQPGQGSRFTLVAPLETTTPVAKERRDVSQDSAGR
jgi:PAS domain S-box-containing protein